MLLPRKHHFCIWCGVVLWTEKNSSKEHVVPECLGGRLQSQDVCRGCNNKFGAESDWKLLHDEEIYRAAIDAGICRDDFLSHYQVTATTDTGLKVTLKVKKGVSHPASGLSGPVFYIGADKTGKFVPSEMKALRARLKMKVRTKHPSLPNTTADAEVDRLFTGLLANGGTSPIYSPLIGEGLMPTRTRDIVSMTKTYHRIDTERAIAKALFTIGKNVVPLHLERSIAESLFEIAKFAQNHNDALPVILSERLPGPASRCHSLRVCIGGSSFCVEAVLFGVQRWWTASTIFCNGKPAQLPEFNWQSIDNPSEGPVIVQTR